MLGWLWSLRWWLGARLLAMAVHVIPPGPVRSDLCHSIHIWGQAWTERIREDKAALLVEDMKRTAETWQH